MWKVQCRMALVRDGLWEIVAGTETAPPEEEAARLSKFLAKRNRALATIVLAVDPALMYLIGDPDDPVAVWKKLQEQFQKKTWANKLALCRRLHALQLKEGESVQDHIKAMTELFNEMAIVGDAIDEEDRVVYLLASLPDSLNTLVTALEVVTEWLLHAERKQKEKKSVDSSGEKAMALTIKGRGPKCHYCYKFGQIQRNCSERIKDERKAKQDGPGITRGRRRDSTSKATEHDAVGLVTRHVLRVSEPISRWVVDSGATCHICNSKELFEEFHPLQVPQQVTIGDGRTLEAVGTGVVSLKLKLLEGEFEIGRLSDVLYVPKLAYNLLSVPRVTELEKEVIFDELQGHILNDQGELVAMASKTGSLYYLHCEPLAKPHINAVSDSTNEKLWHRRFGHLSKRSLHKLAKDELVSGLDYDISKEIDFCESCVNGKICRSPFPGGSRERAEEPLGLVHSDVCGKLNSPSLGGAEYFVTFKTHYVWIYVLKNKH